MINRIVLKNQNAQLRSDVIDLKCRSMKNNLVFVGIAGDSKEENSEVVLRDFLYHELGLEENIKFGNVHIFRRRFRNSPIPIVARFLYHKDLAYVLSQGFRLKGTKFGIREQFPPESEEERRKLYPLVQQMKRPGNTTKIVRDKLFINGQLHNHDNEQNQQRQNKGSMVNRTERSGKRRTTRGHGTFRTQTNQRNNDTTGTIPIEVPSDGRAC